MPFRLVFSIPFLAGIVDHQSALRVDHIDPGM